MRMNQPAPPPSIVRILHSHRSNESQYCGTFTKMSLALEYIPHTLRDQEIFRRSRQQHFSSSEIFSLIFSVSQGLSYLYTCGHSHGNINPKTILFDKSNLAFRITDIQFLTQSSATEYTKLFLTGKSPAQGNNYYLSPKLLAALGIRLNYPTHDHMKSDVFSLGIVAIEIALASAMPALYDFTTFTISQLNIKAAIQEVRRVYSSDVLADLL